MKPNGNFSIVSHDVNVEDDVVTFHLKLFSDDEVKILEGRSTSQKTNQDDTIHEVKDIQSWIEVKNEVIEKEQEEYVWRHVQ